VGCDVHQPIKRFKKFIIKSISLHASFPKAREDLEKSLTKIVLRQFLYESPDFLDYVFNPNDLHFLTINEFLVATKGPRYSFLTSERINIIKHIISRFSNTILQLCFDYIPEPSTINTVFCLLPFLSCDTLITSAIDTFFDSPDVETFCILVEVLLICDNATDSLLQYFNSLAEIISQDTLDYWEFLIRSDFASFIQGNVSWMEIRLNLFNSLLQIIVKTKENDEKSMQQDLILQIRTIVICVSLMCPETISDITLFSIEEVSESLEGIAFSSLMWFSSVVIEAPTIDSNLAHSLIEFGLEEVDPKSVISVLSKALLQFAFKFFVFFQKNSIFRYFSDGFNQHSHGKEKNLNFLDLNTVKRNS
jgi:hypothetical protein